MTLSFKEELLTASSVPTLIPVYDAPTNTEFFDIQAQRQPAVLRGIPIGACAEKWTAAYLAQQVGRDKPVSVHESSSNRLRFLDKNFVYRVMPFGAFIDAALTSSEGDAQNKFYYYRALADDARNVPSDFRRDFPKLALDFVLPDFLEPETVFSCVLRCGSANLGLWLHYDVLDNVLIQIRGRKRAVLFDPEDFDHLYMQGDKSPIFDAENVDLERFPKFRNATKWVCTLEEGDMLFIPAFWMHYMVAEEFSIAVNVFWHNLPKELYDSKDTYGNKELLPYFRASQGLDRALKQLENLPREYRRFYARMLKAKLDKYLTDSASESPKS
ncbi:tRNA wybutosine-synthesizing protein 5-like [Paramacrobiotus metropolitanus]|uniref:tRNA wybutosine-synthesizing protein 5-like n=1 Tax=Paramacrobiotus metropolitanus TaxID=2943436 RepID=UPI0024456AA9|nr:tRNA wybutosine-synthesizing protein 5-like [Paramacrobiotus metropolitanus]